MTFLSASTDEVSDFVGAVASVFLSTAALKITDSLASSPSFTSAVPVPSSFRVKPLCNLVMLPSLAVTLGFKASMAFLFVVILPSLAETFVVKPSMAVVFFLMLPSLVVTRCVNFESKPTVTVGASSAPPTVTVVSLSVPRNLIAFFFSFPRLTAFVLVPSVTPNFAEMLVTAGAALLIFSTNLVESMPNLIVYFRFCVVFPQ